VPRQGRTSKFRNQGCHFGVVGKHELLSPTIELKCGRAQTLTTMKKNWTCIPQPNVSELTKAFVGSWMHGRIGYRTDQDLDLLAAILFEQAGNDLTNASLGGTKLVPPLCLVVGHGQPDGLVRLPFGGHAYGVL
jgi:hypothetical protein